MDRDEPKKKPGPDPDQLHLEGPWEDRVRDALQDALRKERPAEGRPMSDSDEHCPHCQKILYLPLGDYVEGNVVVCEHCAGQSELQKVPSPTQGNLDVKVWHLKPITEE